MPSTASEIADPQLNGRVDRMPALLGMLRHIERSPDSSRSLTRAVDLLIAEYDRAAEPTRPFLTVVLRTQGRRPETLQDSLLCLAGQSVDDFEVIVACHDVNDVDFAAIEKMVAAQPAGFRAQISLLRVAGGRRARPLNEAIAQATGRYISFYDDDDLLFGHWVETFATAAAREPGKLVRAVVASQHARPELWPQDQYGFRHVTWPEAEYPAHFDQLAHLRMNYSPFMGWAFPRQLFAVLGLRFDEELYVCEDWDLILQGSLLCGVVEARELTAIYRRWDGVESSYTTHQPAQWQASQARVLAKLDEYPIVLPPGAVSELRQLFAERDELGRLSAHHHALVTSRGHRYAAPVRGAMKVADIGRRIVRGAARRILRPGSFR